MTIDNNIQERITNYLKNSPKKVADFIASDKSIEYHAKIKQYREIKKISGDEELVRGYLLTRTHLKTLREQIKIHASSINAS